MIHSYLDAQHQPAYTEDNRRPRHLAGFPLAGGVTIFTWRNAALLSILLVAASACSIPLESSPILPTETREVKKTQPELKESHSFPSPSPSPIFAPPPSPYPQITSTTPTCLKQTGTITISEINHPLLSRSLPYRIYFPPCYSETPDVNYPTLFLLHGLQATDQQWDDLGIDERADALISSNQISPLMIVMPWERTGLDLEAALVEVLIPYIDQVYRTIPQRDSRAIGGLSRGGGLAIRIGLKHPDKFTAIGLHSPANLYSSPYIATWVEDISTEMMPYIWIDIGDRDTLLGIALELQASLDELKVPYISQVNPGEHSAAYWRTNIDTYLQWYSSTIHPLTTSEPSNAGFPPALYPTP